MLVYSAAKGQVSAISGQGFVGRASLDELERLGILFEQRARVDEVGRGEIESADFTQCKSERQVGVPRQRRQEQI